MKWRIYSTPEFTKLLFSETIAGAKQYQPREDDMFVFVDWIQTRLNTVTPKKLVAGSELSFPISKKDDVSGIMDFCKFYIRAVRDPISHVCGYQEIIESHMEEIEHNNSTTKDRIKPGTYKNYIDIKGSLYKELFRMTSRTKTDKDRIDGIKALAFTITRVIPPNRDDPDDNPVVCIKIIASTVK